MQRRLRRVLDALEAEGRVERLDGHYRLARADGLVEGRLAAAPDGGRPGRVEDDRGSAWRVTDAGAARPGDRVLVEPLERDAGGRARGEVVRVLEGGREDWVGIFHRRGKGGVVTPYRDDAEWTVAIAPRDVGGASDGDVVVAVPRDAGRRGRRPAREIPSATVTEVLGPPGTPEADFRAVVWRHRLPVAFPAAALAEADAAPAAPGAAEIARRVDLRAHPFVTIDPATARDHDDAVCVEAGPRGSARLWVAIADVSFYVPAGSAMDREALRRGNSVYFPDRAIPMLPERLSSDVCSLRPDEDRLAMVVELEVQPSGKITRRSFYPAVIRSRARLDYDGAARAMEGAPPAGMPPGVLEQLSRLAPVTEALRERRFANGSIDFDLPSAEIVLGDDRRPVDIVRAPRTRAHRAIEDAMLAANRAVAGALLAAGVPALYRNHEEPAAESMRELGDLLAAFGLKDAPVAGASLSPSDLATALARVAGRSEERLVQMAVLRSMRQARYGAENRGHFALAFERYTHFTSPIRRYADLVVHRALVALLERGPGAPTAGLDWMRSAATRVSARERIADDAEREMIDMKQCDFMAPRVGEAFSSTVTGVARQGLYVTLDEVFVEGLVHVSTLPEYVDLDERTHALVARRSGRRYRLGDRLEVRLESVDRVKCWINFSIRTARRSS